jgi:glycosyltransferase involved in cell wall biosynthesis
MKKHNILYTSLSGQMLGGGQRSLLLLLERLDRKKFTPFLVCPSEGGLTEKAVKQGIETQIIKMGRIKSPNLISMAATVFKLRKLITRKKIDLIHTDSPRQAFYTGRAARHTGTPLIWHVRVSTPEKKPFEKFLFNRAHKVIAVSRAASQRFQGFESAQEKVVVIHNGVDLTEFGRPQPDSQLREEFEIEKDRIIVGTLGQLIPGKGQDVFLKAAAQVIKQYLKVKFIMVGDGDKAYRHKLEDRSKDPVLRGKVIFTGFREDIPRIMNLLDIVVLPSTTHLEGLSRVIIEAMASSKPVIATNSGGNPEAVEDGTTGILVPPKDSSMLAESILDLLKDENKRDRMGKEGRIRAEKLFSIEKNISRIEKVYEELLCQKP